MNYPEHIQYIIDRYSDLLLAKVKSEGRKLGVEKVINTFLACDPTQGKRLVDWLAKTYANGGFRWEDVEAGDNSKLYEVLSDYKTSFPRIPRAKRDIYQYKSYGELYRLVEQYLVEQKSEETISGKEEKRLERAQVMEESIVLHRSEEMVVAVPLSEKSAKWWGRGTKWCTAAEKNNYFHQYNRDAPLIVIMLKQKDSMEKTQFRKFQLWIGESENDIQFMDEADSSLDVSTIKQYWPQLEPIINWTIEQNGWFLRQIPNEYITQEMCEQIIEHHPSDLQWIPLHLRSYDLCKRAVIANSNVIRYVPRDYLDLEICRIVIEKQGSNLNNLPKNVFQFLPYELLKSAVIGGANIGFFPTERITPEICELAVENDGLALAFIPTSSRTPELCRKAVEQNGYSLHYVPEEFKTEELCWKALKQNSSAFKYVPKEMQTGSVCREIIKLNPLMLKHVREELIDRELCMLAVEQNGEALQYVPQNFVDGGLYEVAMAQNGLALEMIPRELRSLHLCRLALMQTSNAAIDIPKEIWTIELSIEAVKKYGRLVINRIPDRCKTPELYQTLLEKNPMNLKYLPIELRTEEVCRLTIQKDPQALKWVPEELVASAFKHIECQQQLENKQLQPSKKWCSSGLERLTDKLRDHYSHSLKNKM